MKYYINKVNTLFITNERGKDIFGHDLNGYWCMRDYDQNGKEIYYKNVNGKTEL